MVRYLSSVAMKKILVFLLMAFLSLTCTITVCSANTVLAHVSTVSTSTIEPTYAYKGSLIEYDVDYWWIRNVNKDDIVLLHIVPDANTDYYYYSYLYYSNLTELQYRSGWGTHSHDFVADKTDNYLLKVTSSYALNFTIKHSSLALPTAITFSVKPNPATVGQTVTVLGNLTTENGTPIPSEKLTVKSNGTAVATLTTNTTGWFKASSKVDSAGTYNITIEYAGSTQHLPSSDWEILVINKVQTEIYAKFIPNPVNPGGTCELRGILIDQFGNPIKSTMVSLEYSTDYGLSWHPAGTLTTNSYGIFSKTFTAPSLGTYLIRVKYAGSPSHESSTTVTALIVR